MNTLMKITSTLRDDCPGQGPFFNLVLAFNHFIPTAYTFWLMYEAHRTREVIYKWGSFFSILNIILNYAVFAVMRDANPAPGCAKSANSDVFSVESAAFIFTFMILSRQLYRYQLRDIVMLVGLSWFYSTWIISVTLGVQNITGAMSASAIGTGVGFASVVIVHLIYVPNREWFFSTWLFEWLKARDTVYGDPLGHADAPDEDENEKAAFALAVEARAKELAAAASSEGVKSSAPPAVSTTSSTTGSNAAPNSDRLFV